MVVGSFEVPFAFNLRNKDGKNDFTICRRLIFRLSVYESKNDGESPFTKKWWKEVKTITPPYGRRHWEDSYVLPRELRTFFDFGFREWKGMQVEDYELLVALREQMVPGSLTKENYHLYLHNCLWLEEVACRRMLLRYNMEDVHVNLVDTNNLMLAVPGLAEKRPSLLQGDTVRIRVHNDHKAYEGYIKRVEDRYIIIKSMDRELLHTLAQQPNLELDVAFQLGRIPLERAHEGVARLYSRETFNNLFPDTQSYLPYVEEYQLGDQDFFNKDIVSNLEQRIAVLKILNCSSHGAPYIVFGPPGTGKTVTIVEAVCQIVQKTSKRVLVCAPSNAACDMLTSKLIPHYSTKQLLRLHSPSRDMRIIPMDVKKYSNIFSERYQSLDANDLKQYNIVVTTLIAIGRKEFQTYGPDCVFIDEAAQATETDCSVPLGAVKYGGTIVLAGDPQQLGPIVHSHEAQDYGLNKSLLERLMNTQNVYKNENTNFISMLKKNFRSHPDILRLPNETFYDSKLEAVSEKPRNDPISKIDVYSRLQEVIDSAENEKNLTNGQAFEFCGISAQEQREGRSPSYFNLAEAKMVIEYIKALISLELPSEYKVKPSDIGVITPYVRQVHKIRELLIETNIIDVEVGSVEVFQGTEKRIIIISTVRAQEGLLNYDHKYALGFVKEKRRFNVALTRAISKLIVIGCPTVLATDTNWMNLIDLCRKMNTYHGAQFEEFTEDKMKEIIERFQAFPKLIN